MNEIEIKQLGLIEAQQHHHIVIMTNENSKEYPLAIGFSNDMNEVEHIVFLDLHTANKLGEKFCTAYNDMLIKVRGDQ
jgi:hypothetical protein